jgi:hypothetical protein
MSRRRAMTLFAPLILVSTACNSEPPEPPEPLPPDLTEFLGPDEARAGWLGSADSAAFIGGAAGESREGDLLIYNDRARFALQGWREGHNLEHHAGTIIDVDIVRPDDMVDRDVIDDLGTLMSLGRIFAPETLDIVSDGSDGGAAVIRATGTDAGFAYLLGAMEDPDLYPELGLAIVQTLTLEPGSELLRIETVLHNPTDAPIEVSMIDGGVLELGLVSGFVPGLGVDEVIDSDGAVLAGYASRYNDLAVGLLPGAGLVPSPGSSALLADLLGFALIPGPDLELPPGGEQSYLRYLGVAPDMATLERARLDLGELPRGTVTGTLSTEGAGDPIAGARIYLVDAEGAPWTFAITGADGGYRIDAPPGDWSLVALGDGEGEVVDIPEAAGSFGTFAGTAQNQLQLDALGGDQSVAVVPRADGYGRGDLVAVTLLDGEEQGVDLLLPEPARLNLSVVDGTGSPSPAVVQIRFAEGYEDPRPSDRRLGEHRPDGARKIVWLADGEMEVAVPAGEYDLVGYRGFRHELAEQDGLVLGAGQTAFVELVIPRAYETPGWVSADFHSHASPSMEGKCTMEDRLLQVAASDLQLHVATAHDAVPDYQSPLEALGLQPWVRAIPATEVTTLLRGHFNIFPMTQDRAQPNFGAPVWWELEGTTEELFAVMREDLPDNGVIQVNHGRTPGMFTFAGWDPDADEADYPSFYADDFDAMELLQFKNYDTMDQLLLDWCSHLDLGYRKTATGVSDEHAIRPGAGYARSYVRVGTDEPAEVDLDTFMESVAGGRVVVSGGPFIVFTATDEEGGVVDIGEEISADLVTLHIEVWAPTWMDVDQVRLRGDGCGIAATWDSDSMAEGEEQRFVTDLEWAVDEDAYLFVEAEGEDDLWPVWSGAHAYAASNPIYLRAP